MPILSMTYRYWKPRSSNRGGQAQTNKMNNITFAVILTMGLAACTLDTGGDKVYDLASPAHSRQISFENPTGAKGAGAKAAGKLGPGRKGAPFKILHAGKTMLLCDIKGPGVIGHVWMTMHNQPQLLQGIVIRAYWDHQSHPSIEAPLGPFFGTMHGQLRAYQSAVHSINAAAGLNCWMPMPFKKNARIELVNQSSTSTPIYYQIDYTVGDKLPRELGFLHAVYRRENPTQLKKDFEILPKRRGKGRFLGCVLGVRALWPGWWGEGEFKVYLDGDKQFPTICGTGTEDYIGQSWTVQDAQFLYGGTSLIHDNLCTMYRWHIKDPIYWKKDVRITMQQIGNNQHGLSERQDDWSVCSFWYEPLPSQPLPPMPGYEARVAN